MLRSIRCLLLASLILGIFAGSVGAMYEPHLGRFLQPDPLGTGSTLIIDGQSFHGRATRPVPPIGADLSLHYFNGPNHFEYVGSNPVTRADPLGLMFGSEQIFGPGWGQGGVWPWGQRTRLKTSNWPDRFLNMRGSFSGGINDEFRAGKYRIGGALLAHLQYGDNGNQSLHVLFATLGAIVKDLDANVRGATPWDIPGTADKFFEAQWGEAGLGTVKGVAGIGFDYLADAGDRAFRKGAERFASPALAAAGMYAGTMEYMVTDIYNWGFGVEGGDLYGLWD